MFSQRKGLTPARKAMQQDSMDKDLRNGLWNAFYNYCWAIEIDRHGTKSLEKGTYDICVKIWCDLRKLPVDEMPSKFDFNIILQWLKKRFINQSEWFEVYDFVEFVAKYFYYKKQRQEFKDECNRILELESSAYRFVGDELTRITSEEEISQIEQALSTPLAPVNEHIRNSLEKLSNRKKPDYRNSIKEAISAVESMCSLLAGKKKADLSEGLKVIKDKIGIHPALEQAFKKLYGYTSDEGGVRHAIMDEAKVEFEEAKFMLVSCSAFINYLIGKTAKAGIDLSNS